MARTWKRPRIQTYSPPVGGASSLHPGDPSNPQWIKPKVVFKVGFKKKPPTPPPEKDEEIQDVTPPPIQPEVIDLVSEDSDESIYYASTDED
jgi:hypothetical protein